MGYKSVIRSISAASNKAARKNEREYKRQQRELEKLQKKMQNANEKLESIFTYFNDEYAKGKINKEQFEELKKRKLHITLDSVVIGKAPFVSLAKRYVTGRIDREEFIEMQKDILPLDLLKERKAIKVRFKKFAEELNTFRENCKNVDEKNCQYCNAKKSVFNGLKKIEGFTLCRKCRNTLKTLQKYSGFRGKYLFVNPFLLSFSQLDEGLSLNINIRDELF